MPDPPVVAATPERLRVAGRSVLAAVAVVVATFVGLRILASAERVIAWLLIAIALAVLVSPAVELIARRIPRGLGVAIVVALGLGVVGGVTYGFVGDVVAQTRNLEREAPRFAARLETEGRFSDAAREARLSERTRRFVAEVPARLRGGTPAEALRSATTRGLALLAVTVLTLFLLLHGPAIAIAAARQIHDDERQARAVKTAKAVYRRSFGYARGTIAMSALAGVVSYLLARATGVPGPAPLALWVALWDVVPLVGAVVGALPIVVLAAVLDPAKGALLIAAFIAYQVVEYVFLQRRLERSTVHIGPFLTTAAGFAGLELYGLAGALLAMLAVAVGAVVLDELSPIN